MIQNLVENLVETLLQKVKIELISESTVWNVLHFVFLYVQVEVYQETLNIKRWPIAFKSYKAY